MNPISCDMCQDLLPLVTDDIASEDSRAAVLLHIEDCARCRAYYTEDKKAPIDAARVTGQIQKRLSLLALALAGLGVAFGLGIAAGELMFYNIILLPTIGALGYLGLRRRCYYVLALVFVTVYLRWLPHSIGYLTEGAVGQPLLPPLLWALIYAGLCLLGMVIAFLIHFGLKKEPRTPSQTDSEEVQ